MAVFSHFLQPRKEWARGGFIIFYIDRKQIIKLKLFYLIEKKTAVDRKKKYLFNRTIFQIIFLGIICKIIIGTSRGKGIFNF